MGPAARRAATQRKTHDRLALHARMSLLNGACLHGDPG
jgi:hypothetical protein